MAPQTSSRSTKGLVSSRRGDKGCNIVRGKENHADADMAAKIKPNVTKDIRAARREEQKMTDYRLHRAGNFPKKLPLGVSEKLPGFHT